MLKLPFPTALARKRRLYCGRARREVRLEQGMGDLSHCLRCGPAIELFGAIIPGHNVTRRVPHENSIVGGVDECSLHDQAFGLLLVLMFQACPLGDITNDGDDEEVIHLVTASQRAQAHLDGEGATILAVAEELQARAHRSGMRRGHILCPMLFMDGVEMARQQHLDWSPEQQGAGVAEKHLDLVVHEQNMSGRVGDDDGIRSQFEEGLREYPLGQRVAGAFTTRWCRQRLVRFFVPIGGFLAVMLTLLC